MLKLFEKQENSGMLESFQKRLEQKEAWRRQKVKAFLANRMTSQAGVPQDLSGYLKVQSKEKVMSHRAVDEIKLITSSNRAKNEMFRTQFPPKEIDMYKVALENTKASHMLSNINKLYADRSRNQAREFEASKMASITSQNQGASIFNSEVSPKGTQRLGTQPDNLPNRDSYLENPVDSAITLFPSMRPHKLRKTASNLGPVMSNSAKTNTVLGFRNRNFRTFLHPSEPWNSGENIERVMNFNESRNSQECQDIVKHRSRAKIFSDNELEELKTKRENYMKSAVFNQNTLDLYINKKSKPFGSVFSLNSGTERGIRTNQNEMGENELISVHNYPKIVKTEVSPPKKNKRGQSLSDASKMSKGVFASLQEDQRIIAETKRGKCIVRCSHLQPSSVDLSAPFRPEPKLVFSHARHSSETEEDFQHSKTGGKKNFKIYKASFQPTTTTNPENNNLFRFESPRNDEFSKISESPKKELSQTFHQNKWKMCATVRSIFKSSIDTHKTLPDTPSESVEKIVAKISQKKSASKALKSFSKKE